MQERKSLNGKARKKKSYLDFSMRINLDDAKVTFKGDLLRSFKGKYTFTGVDKGVIYLMAMDAAAMEYAGFSTSASFIPTPKGGKSKTQGRSIFVNDLNEFLPNVRRVDKDHLPNVELKECDLDRTTVIRDYYRPKYGKLVDTMYVYTVVIGEQVPKPKQTGSPEGILALQKLAAEKKAAKEAEEATVTTTDESDPNEPDTMDEVENTDSLSEKKEAVSPFQ